MRRPCAGVSIVVPNYNYARYLDERLQTLLDQTFGDFELIITDDASTDDSRSVIERYTHTRASARSIRRQQRLGLPAGTTPPANAGANTSCSPRG